MNNDNNTSLYNEMMQQANIGADLSRFTATFGQEMNRFVARLEQLLTKYKPETPVSVVAESIRPKPLQEEKYPSARKESKSEEENTSAIKGTTSSLRDTKSSIDKLTKQLDKGDKSKEIAEEDKAGTPSNLGSGSGIEVPQAKGISQFNSAIKGSSLALASMAGQITANIINFKAQQLANPFQSVSDEIIRNMQYGMQQSETLGMGGGVVAGAMAGGAIGSVIPVLGTTIGAAIGAFAGGGLGQALGSYFGAETTLDSDEYATGVSRLTGAQLDPNQVKKLAGAFGIDKLSELAELRASTAGDFGGVARAANTFATVGENRKEVGESFGMVGASTKELIQTYSRLNAVTKLAGSDADSFTKIVRNTGFSMNQVLDVAEQLATAPAVVEGRESLASMTQRTLEARQRNPLMAQQIQDFEQMGFVGKTVTGAMAQAFLGSSVEDITSGKVDREQAISNLKASGLSVDMLKDVAPQIYDLLAATGKQEQAIGEKDSSKSTLESQTDKLIATAKENSEYLQQIAENTRSATSATKNRPDEVMGKTALGYSTSPAVSFNLFGRSS